MKVALYARVSSDQQADKNNSIPSQLRLLHEYALKHDMQVYKEYIDEGESALSINRPAFLEMIREAKAKYPSFQSILVWKLSRFARNRQDSIVYKSMLKKRGIDIISISEPIDDTPQGQLMEGIIEVIDEFYSAVLSQETLRGMIENARRGYRNGGNAAFGYKNIRIYDEKNNPKMKFEIKEKEAEIVYIIFDIYAKGNGLKNIVKFLNDNGYKPRSASHWSKSTIADILRNEAYIGWTVFNKKDKKTEGKKYKSKDEWIVIKNTHDPIISLELFNKVQKQIELRMPSNTPAQTTASKYILSGLMKCGNCGASYGISGYGRKKGYAYYNCLSYSKKGKKVCEGRRLRADRLEEKIANRVKDLVFSEENLQKMINDINAVAKSLKTDYGEKILKLRKKLNDIQKRISRQYEAIESGLLDIFLVAERLKELRDQKEKMDKEISQIEELSKKSYYIQIDRRTIEKFQQEMEEIFIGDNPQEKREFLKKFIEKIVVNNDNITIKYYLPNSKALNIFHESKIFH